MMDGFSVREIESSGGVKIHAEIGGAGPPVLLLHGYPETHLCWRKVAPGLVAAGFTVVAADLRGYGDSGKPETAPDHAPYSKRATGQDQIDLMAALGFTRFALVGHDRGGRVAHRMALDHPKAIERIAVLDIAPTATMYAQTDRVFAQAYYHWFFLIQPFDVPERLIGSDPAWYLKRTLGVLDGPTATFDAETVAEYVRAFSAPGAVHGACEDYRAAASIDLVHDSEDDAAGRKIEAPLLVLWGARGMIERRFDALANWREKARDVRGEALPCGHYLPEEAPQETLRALLAFLKT
jgi:haloacetate dehalogenase